MPSAAALFFLLLACADAPIAPRLVSAIDIKDFGAETLRIGDLDADGEPDLLFVQSVFRTREITCITATTIAGRIIWQSGAPSAENGRIYSDLPVQVYDWDDDGRNEVLYIRQARYIEPPGATGPRERADRYEGQATMLILDDRTGREIGSLPIPAPADDCFLFADLTGRGRRADLVVKDRYWNVWGVSHEGKEIWRWTGSPGHFPAIADIDADGKDEVFVGFALIDNDGKPIFEKDPKGAHQDACWILRHPAGDWRLLFGNAGIHCLSATGSEHWAHPLGEAQHVIAGRFLADPSIQLVVVDRTPIPSHRRDENAWAILYLYDLDGKEIWRREQPKGAWAIAPLAVNWSGHANPRSILIYGRGLAQPAVLYDGAGRIVETFPMRVPPGRPESDARTDFYALAADVSGDERDEVILFGARGACIYANARALSIETLYNETLYPGM